MTVDKFPSLYLDHQYRCLTVSGAYCFYCVECEFDVKFLGYVFGMSELLSFPDLTDYCEDRRRTFLLNKITIRSILVETLGIFIFFILY